jgi:hypothetical protein
MSHNSGLAKFLRFIGILFMALTGGFTLMGGLGTSCVAFNPTGFGEGMAPLAQYQWLYIIFMLGTTAIGVWGIWATVKLIKGTPNAYLMSLKALVAGVVVGGFHIYMSRLLRGKSMPVDAVVYMTVLTLVIFLLFRIPGIWQGVNFDKGNGGNNKMAGGAAAIVLGLLCLTIQYIAGPTHTWNGVNYADAFNTAMTIIGIACLLIGTGVFASIKNLKLRSNQLEVATGNA